MRIGIFRLRNAVSYTIVLLISTTVSAGDGARTFNVPDGFTVEPVALPPLVQRPMLAGFDERGRLFVAESAGLNLDYQKLRADPPNFIRMLEDADGDGVFDKSTIFADRMTFPAGALWHDGALYVCDPPGVWKLEDTNDDGVCDRRTQIVTGFHSVGNGADLHGPFLGPDGWLYFADGRNGHDLTLGDGSRWAGKAACVYRCRTDGSGLEVVFGGGMDNPVDAVFTPTGEMLVTCNIVLARPQRLDGILYGIEGGVYPHDAALTELPRTGDLLKCVGDLGWSAVSGMTRFEGRAFGEGFDGNLFSALFNRRRVQRHTVVADAAGFRIDANDFLTCDETNFHPTDVLQDADGSLLVVDTGGWFRIGCPVSQEAKPNELGGIYRIRRADSPRVADPRGQNLNWRDPSATDLVDRLRDARPAVAERAAFLLAKMDDGEPPLETLATGGSSRDATAAVWTLMRRNTPTARASVRAAMDHPNAAVRRTAIRAAGLVRDRHAGTQLIRALASDDLPESREAALALARVGDASATAPILARLARSSDPFHTHALTFALLRIGDRDGTAKGLADRSAIVRRAAVIALDQMPGGTLTFEEVAPLLAAAEPSVRGEAMAVVAKHAEWAAGVPSQFRATLTRSPQDGPALRGLVVAFAGDTGVQRAVADALGDAATSAAAKAALLDAASIAPAGPLPNAWAEAVGKLLLDADPAVARAAVDVVRARGVASFDDRLLLIARDSARDAALRVAALAAAAPRVAPDQVDFAFLVAQLAADRPPLDRLATARCLAAMKVSDAQLMKLAATALPSAGPLEIDPLLGAFERSTSAEVGTALVAALNASPAAKRLSATVLRSALARYPAGILAAAEPLLKQVDAGDAGRATRLAELEPLLAPSAGGDASRGQSVFLGKTAACTTCHAIGGAGGQVGPDLSKIGALRSGRDLLESIVFPAASIARGFEPLVVETTDGDVHAGTLAGESADAIRLKTPAEVTIPRSRVKSIRQDRTSIMPQGLDAQLSKQELADLLAFLQACK
jgi:putative heme-binding domain-containing protein